MADFHRPYRSDWMSTFCGKRNGSGAVAHLETARPFSRLYSNPKTRGKYNLLFGLTSGGPYNYNGTNKWLRSFDQRVRESIDYAICLNSIGSWNNELWMHVSKPPENPYIKQIFEEFSDVSKQMGVSVGIKHKKINVSNPIDKSSTAMADFHCPYRVIGGVPPSTMSSLPSKHDMYGLEEFRLLMSHRPTENLSMEGLEQASIDT
ncbi:hypothetical protein ABZP36_032748 [Zizania latifolia]